MNREVFTLTAVVAATLVALFLARSPSTAEMPEQAPPIQSPRPRSLARLAPIAGARTAADISHATHHLAPSETRFFEDSHGQRIHYSYTPPTPTEVHLALKNALPYLEYPEGRNLMALLLTNGIDVTAFHRAWVTASLAHTLDGWQSTNQALQAASIQSMRDNAELSIVEGLRITNRTVIDGILDTVPPPGSTRAWNATVDEGDPLLTVADIQDLLNQR